MQDDIKRVYVTESASDKRILWEGIRNQTLLPYHRKWKSHILSIGNMPIRISIDRMGLYGLRQLLTAKCNGVNTVCIKRGW